MIDFVRDSKHRPDVKNFSFSFCNNGILLHFVDFVLFKVKVSLPKIKIVKQIEDNK